KLILYLRSPKIEKFVIVEPGPHPSFDPDMHRFVKPDHIIDGSNYDALRKLDVIAVDHIWRTRPEIISAITRAVRDDGVGFLQQSGFGLLSPYLTRQVCDLSGMEYADLF